MDERKYFEEKARKGKRHFPLALMMGLGMIVLVAAIFAIVFYPMFDNSEDKPFGGAKIKKQEIWSDNGLIVTAEELGTVAGKNRAQEVVYLTINNGTPQELTLRCEGLAVNGAAVQSAFAETVPSGNSVRAALPLDYRALYDMRIRTVGEIRMQLAAYDTASGKKAAASGPLTLTTSKAKKADPPSYMYSTDGFYAKDGITLALTSLYPAYTDESGAVGFYVENNTDRDVLVAPKDTAVDGFPYLKDESYVFPAGTKGTFYLELVLAELEDVLPMEKLTGTMVVSDRESGTQIAGAPFEFKP